MAVISRLPYGGGGSPIKTINLVLEGANEDTITITDQNDEVIGVCVFPSGSTIGEIELVIIEGEEYTFTSSIAKDTDTGTGDYSRKEVLTAKTSRVKVMPDNTLYWYGNNVDFSANDYSWYDTRYSSFSTKKGLDGATVKTNSLYLTTNGNNRTIGTSKTYDVSNISNIKFMANRTGGSNSGRGWIYGKSGYNGSLNEIKMPNPTSGNIHTIDITMVSGNQYLGFGMMSLSGAPLGFDVLAVWLE